MKSRLLLHPVCYGNQMRHSQLVTYTVTSSLQLFATYAVRKFKHNYRGRRFRKVAYESWTQPDSHLDGLQDDSLVVNWKGCGRRRLWPNLRQSSSINVGGGVDKGYLDIRLLVWIRTWHLPEQQLLAASDQPSFVNFHFATHLQFNKILSTNWCTAAVMLRPETDETQRSCRRGMWCVPASWPPSQASSLHHVTARSDIWNDCCTSHTPGKTRQPVCTCS